MPSLVQVEEQIYVLEGFRVKLTPLFAKTKSFPSYDFTAMAPQKWKVSDWKTARLGAYLTLVKTALIERGDGAPVKGDLQLGNIRDTYYEATYGPIGPTGRSSG